MRTPNVTTHRTVPSAQARRRLAGGVILGLLLLGARAWAVSLDLDAIRDEEIARIAQRLHEQCSGCSSAEDSMKKCAAEFDPQVRQLLEVQNRTEGTALYGAFAEVTPKDDQDIDFARGYFDPIRVLARAYALPGSEYYRSEAVLEAIHLGFAYTGKHAYPGCEKAGNWWVWAKQMPDCLCDILALLATDLSPGDKAYLISTLDYLLGEGPIADTGYHYGKSGKDAVNTLKVGILSEDRERIARAWEGMENVVGPYLLEAEGTPFMTVLKPEFLGVSLPYVYEGYATVVEWMQLTHGTKLALRPETTGKLADYCLGLGRWNTFKGTEVAWLSFTPYRIFWRPARTLSLAGSLGGLGAPRATELKAMADGTDTPPEGARFWPKAETLIYRSRGLYCAVIMASRNRHPLSWSYKNYFLHIGNKWYWNRDGHLVIARGRHDTDPNLSYTQDWRRLTGITRDDGSVLERRVIEDHGYWKPAYIPCENPMAGAATLNGRDAVAGIEVHSGETHARKSYFFLHDEGLIVTLGSHIRGHGETESIVHTFPVGADSQGITVDGKPIELEDGAAVAIETPAWAHGPGGGYYFPDPGQVTLLAETREPDFEDHGNPPPEEQPDAPPQRFVSILWQHGSDPQDTAYACIYIPKAQTQAMSGLVQDLRARMSHGRDQTGHFFTYGAFSGRVFFEPGTLQGYQTNRPCLVAVRRNETQVSLALYEPSWTECQLRLGLPFHAKAQPSPGGRLDGDTLIASIRPGHPIEYRLTEK